MGKKLSPQLQKSLSKMKAKGKTNILALSANEAVNHFKDNFKAQKFVGSLRKWKKRKKIKVKGKLVANDPGRGILIKSGKLKKMIRRSHLNTKRAIIGIAGSVAPKYASVHNFGLMSGRGKGFKMPQRKFMGESRVLNKKISRIIKREVKKIL